jgi:ribosomal subunit interface protein
MGLIDPWITCSGHRRPAHLAPVPSSEGRTALADHASAIDDRVEMEVAVHDRTHSLPNDVRAHVEEKVVALADHLDLISAAEVEFDRDVKKRREPLNVVKVTLHLVGHRLRDLRASETGPDQRATFDRAIEKIDGEVTRLKERVKAH